MKDLTEVLNAAKAMLEEIELQPSGYDYRPYYAFRNRSQLNDPDAAVIRLKKAVAASHAHDGDAARSREAPMTDKLALADEPIDIVERLRDWGHPDWFYVTTDLLSDNQDVRLDAADEIERLRAAAQGPLTRP